MQLLNWQPVSLLPDLARRNEGGCHVLSYLMLSIGLLSVTSTFGNSKLGSAEVRQLNGDPCFSITQSDANRGKHFLLNSLTVYDATVKPPKEVWSFNLPPAAPHKIIPATCIPYGQALLKSESMKAVPLASGRIYEVYINASSSSPTDPTFVYEAKFCVLDQPKDGTTIHQIIFDKAWRYEPCFK